MLPADTIAQITTNLAALQLEPSTAAQILAAVFAPLLRSEAPTPADLEEPSRRPRSNKRRKKPKRQVFGALRDYLALVFGDGGRDVDGELVYMRVVIATNSTSLYISDGTGACVALDQSV